MPFGTELVWNGHPNRGQVLVNKLQNDFGVVLADHPGGAGLILDFEDYFENLDSMLNTPTSQLLLNEDPRFDNASPTAEAKELYYRYVGSMIDARLAKIAVLAPWTGDEQGGLHSSLFDYDRLFALDFTSSYTKAYGRNRATVVIYGNGSGAEPIADGIMRLGERVFQINGKRPKSAPLFDLWFDASENVDVINPKDPMGGPFWSIIESIELIKSAMVLGSPRILSWRSSEHPAHPYFAIPVAFDDLQPFADYIKYGKTYVPPPAMARFIGDNVDDTNGQKITPFYAKKANGADLPAEVFICCRMWGEQMLFHGCRTSGDTESFDVIGPHGQTVSVLVSRYGSVTVVEG